MRESKLGRITPFRLSKANATPFILARSASIASAEDAAYGGKAGITQPRHHGNKGIPQIRNFTSEAGICRGRSYGGE